MTTMHFRDFVMIIAMLTVVSASARAAEPRPGGSLSGVVVDPDGKPVSGAIVFLDAFQHEREQTGDFHPEIKTSTASDGSFHLEALEPIYRDDFGCKDLRIIAPGYAPHVVQAVQFSVFSGADNNLGKVKLDRGQVVCGQVLDVDGKPRAGAVVECQACRFTGPGFIAKVTPVYRLITDADGRFTTPPLPVSFAGLTVRAPGRRMLWRRVAIGPEGRQQIDPIRLESAAPIVGVVRDEHGKPVKAAKISARSVDSFTAWLTEDQLATDDEGRFSIEGMGRAVNLRITSDDHLMVRWGLRKRPDGLYWSDFSKKWDLKGPVDPLIITAACVAWIDGRATDADTGEPVKVKEIVRCSFTRNAHGEVVLNGCYAAEFHQDADGTFHVSYNSPREYHLTLSAVGYDDCEAFTPPVETLQPISGVSVKLHKSKGAKIEPSVRQTISGRVTRDGQPVKTGWVALQFALGQKDRLNVDLCRGRTVICSGNEISRTAVIHDGRYSLDVPFEDGKWLVIVDAPNQPPTSIGPVTIGRNERKTLDIVAEHGGGISGRVKDIPAEWKKDTWVVAFTTRGFCFQTPVDAEGRFSFTNLPAGEYGLKAGYDAYRDSEVPTDGDFDIDVENPALIARAEPWKRATIVTVEADRVADDVALELPGEK